ncbi:hypothetical protein I4F81_000262 [Pyropia yezoensis]|uniref:Uncharacterized protein n=1 Tax=Pyropia yezoensis TaxID=2788 RepID=A0ACC3BJI0_PYRYE|nr:hypothetical protein I4F81_000262 [Neopyropia yezoensis]
MAWGGCRPCACGRVVRFFFFFFCRPLVSSFLDEGARETGGGGEEGGGRLEVAAGGNEAAAGRGRAQRGGVADQRLRVGGGGGGWQSLGTAVAAGRSADMRSSPLCVSASSVNDSFSPSPSPPAPLLSPPLTVTGIYSEYDRYFFPSIVDKAASGKLKYIIGSGTNRFDWTYAGNVAQAHEMACLALTPASPLAGGVYFITNDDARPLWGFLGDLVAPLGYPRPRVHLPLWLVLGLATLVEAVAALLAPLGMAWETDFTRARMVLASCERRVSCAAARRDFAYVPEVGVDEAVRRTVAHFEGLRAR